MPPSQQASRAARRTRTTTSVLLALPVAAVVAAVLGFQALTASSPAVLDVLPTHGGVLDRSVPDGVTVDDGVVAAGATVFDDGLPAVAGLDPALLRALRRAAAAAAEQGVAFSVTSGWRSAGYQEQLLREAVARYGSAEEAARWVATPETSAHVSGQAVDLGPADARRWLAGHGAAYDLCQIYRNEPWHYELRPGASEDGCPAMYADPTHDPRMHP